MGGFLESHYKRRILTETLSVDGSVIFSRNGGLKIEDLTVIRNMLVNAFEQNAEGAIALAVSNLNEEELFLMNGFKTMFSSKLVSLISEWLDNKFMVIYRADALHLIRKFSDAGKKSVYVEKTINRSSRLFWN